MGSNLNAVAKLMLVFFISLLSFSIGTYVGKKYSDNQHRLAQLEPSESGHREVASEEAGHQEEHGTATAASSHEKSENLSDEEIAKLAEEFVADDAPTQTAEHSEHKAEADEHGAPAKDAHGKSTVTKAHAHDAKTVAEERPASKTKAAAHSTEATHEDKIAAVAHGLAKGHEPVAEKKVVNESRMPSSLPKDVAQYSVGKFTVQVASFASETEAKAKAEQLKDKGYSAFYVPASIKGKTWYRVSVGLFATEKEAKDYRQEFQDKTKIDVIVQKIVN